MKNDYRIRARKFVVELAPYLEDCCKCKDFAYAIDSYNRDYNRTVRFCYGISRVVFISQDYVVKVTYRHSNMFGDCESEYKMYLKAQEDGYDYLFASIDKMEYKGRNYYIMPRIPNVGREILVREVLTDDECEYLYENDIEDLDENYSNTGWINNRPVIIDYACNCYIEEE